MLVLPSPSFGFSPHHRAWPGTITLSLETFNGLVTDVIESLHRTGFKRMLIVNGHGGNQGPLTSTCTALASRGIEVGYVNYMSPGQKQWLEVLPGATRGVAHACAYETSLQMALRPAEAERIAAKVANLPPRLDRRTPPATRRTRSAPPVAISRRSSRPAMSVMSAIRLPPPSRRARR